MSNKGFTLIEVLMVVLIVGILASLAMPQYTKVVEKAKMSEAKTVLSAIRTAEGVYFMEYDAYTTTLANLDLDTDIHTGNNLLFSYSVALTGTAGSQSFSVTSTRVGGSFDGATLVMAADGNLTSTGTYTTQKMIKQPTN